jgi:hypothetical protein
MVWVLDGDQLGLKPRRVVEEELRQMFSGVSGSLAAELVAERRGSRDPGNRRFNS